MFNLLFCGYFMLSIAHIGAIHEIHGPIKQTQAAFYNTLFDSY